MNITGDYQPNVNLGHLNINDKLKIKVLVPGIKNTNNMNAI